MVERVLSTVARKRLERIERNNRRRARNKGQRAVPVDFVAQCEAQGWACSICGEPMDPELDPMDPMSISLEHSPALATGGHHIPEHVEGAHRACNVRKAAERDTKVAAKIKRQQRRTGPQSPHRKAKKRAWPKRGFQTNRDSAFKKKIGGKVERREP